MIDKRNKIENEERAILVGIVHKDQTEQQLQEYLDELAFLAETAGAVAVKRFTQKLPPAVCGLPELNRQNLKCAP